MLNGFTAKTEARRISLSVSRPSLASAQLADVVAGFYRGRPVGGPGGGVGAISEGMIGMPDGAGAGKRHAARSRRRSRRKSPDGTPAYTSAITGLVGTAESAVLIRNLLLAQHDGNAAIVLAGPATGVVRMLDLYRSGPQIAAKCKQLVVAAGSFPAGPPDATIKSDVAAAKRLFAEWPTPIVAVGSGGRRRAAVSGREHREGLRVGAGASGRRRLPRRSSRCPTTHPASALAAVLYAVHPDDGYFKLSDPGTITVLDDGRTRFTPAAEGKHRYLIVDPAQKERVLARVHRDGVGPAGATAGPGRGGAA